MTAQQSTRKNITQKLIKDSIPDKSFYNGEYGTWVLAIVENIEKSIGRKLTPKDFDRVLESI